MANEYRFLLRMPQALRDKLREASGEAGRSLNGEVVARLEGSLDKSDELARRPQRARLSHEALPNVLWLVVAIFVVAIVVAALGLVGALG